MVNTVFYSWSIVDFIHGVPSILYQFSFSHTPRELLFRPVASHFLKMGLAAIAGGIAQVKPVFEPETYEKETDV